MASTRKNVIGVLGLLAAVAVGFGAGSYRSTVSYTFRVVSKTTGASGVLVRWEDPSHVISNFAWAGVPAADAANWNVGSDYVFDVN